ncbi:hypothetical protein E2C01_043113 [Portunus trituberculatus]|uniref:Uncharacterized protein n=1 Tax=Portunus trituberculatus TaxID=210409 RepID=A0A5B7FVF2_PORTR|nr:hypothetical protein [Portunus trituberculatus]
MVTRLASCSSPGVSVRVLTPDGAAWSATSCMRVYFSRRSACGHTAGDEDHRRGGPREECCGEQSAPLCQLSPLRPSCLRLFTSDSLRAPQGLSRIPPRNKEPRGAPGRGTRSPPSSRGWRIRGGEGDWDQTESDWSSGRARGRRKKGGREAGRRGGAGPGGSWTERVVVRAPGAPTRRPAELQNGRPGRPSQGPLRRLLRPLRGPAAHDKIPSAGEPRYRRIRDKGKRREARVVGMMVLAVLVVVGGGGGDGDGWWWWGRCRGFLVLCDGLL